MKPSLVHHSWWIAPLALLFCLALTLPLAPALPPDDDSPYLRIDPEKIVLNPRDDRRPCGECHLLEYAVWEETPHATTFDELHRTEQARAILDRMGLRLAKRESLCLRCHYTTKVATTPPKSSTSSLGRLQAFRARAATGPRGTGSTSTTTSAARRV